VESSASSVRAGPISYTAPLYDYVRNTDFDANDFFNNQQGQPRAVLQRNQYGGTFGGPIVIPISWMAQQAFLLLLLSGPEANAGAAGG
jgi:hypothetical protein